MSIFLRTFGGIFLLNRNQWTGKLPGMIGEIEKWTEIAVAKCFLGSYLRMAINLERFFRLVISDNYAIE